MSATLSLDTASEKELRAALARYNAADLSNPRTRATRSLIVRTLAERFPDAKATLCELTLGGWSEMSMQRLVWEAMQLAFTPWTRERMVR